MMRLTGHRKRWPALRLCRFARVLEQEVQGFVRLDVAGDAAHRAILLKFHVHGGHRLALLASDPFHFVVDFVARGMNALALADLSEHHRCLDLADGLLAPRFLQMLSPRGWPSRAAIPSPCPTPIAVSADRCPARPWPAGAAPRDF